MTTLKNMLDEKGIKQRKICELSGIDDAVLSQIVNARRQPSGPQKALIVYALNELSKGGPYSIEDFWPESVEKPCSEQTTR